MALPGPVGRPRLASAADQPLTTEAAQAFWKGEYGDQTVWYTRFLDRDETWVPQMQSTGALPAPSTGETPRVDVPQRYPSDPAASIHAQTQYRRWRCRRGFDRSSGYSTLLSLLCPVRQDDSLGGASGVSCNYLMITWYDSQREATRCGSVGVLGAA